MKKRWVINTPPEATKIEELSKKLNCHPPDFVTQKMFIL